MNTLPRRRTDLVVTDLDGERVVFDAATNTAHKLTADAVAVWQRCDGTSSLEAAGAELSLTTAQVSAAAAELIDAGLADAPGFSRRRLLQGGAVVGAVFVSSVVLPAANAAASPTIVNPGTGSQTITYDVFTEFSRPNVTNPFTFYGAAGSDGTALPGVPAATPFSSMSSPNVNGFPEGTGTANGRQTNEVSDGVEFPLFYTVTGGAFTGSTASVPDNTFGLHPGPTERAVIAFRNPGGGTTLTIAGTVTRRDTDPSHGNGVHASIYDNARAQVPGAGANATTTAYGTPAGFGATLTNVPAGDVVYVVIDNNGNYQYDTTELDLTVTVGP